MAGYDLFITYKKSSGKGDKKNREIINFKNMMDATLKRLEVQDDPDVESVEVKVNQSNDFPFDNPDLFED